MIVAGERVAGDLAARAFHSGHADACAKTSPFPTEILKTKIDRVRRQHGEIGGICRCRR